MSEDCPLCGIKFPHEQLNQHVNYCLDATETPTKRPRIDPLPQTPREVKHVTEMSKYLEIFPDKETKDRETIDREVKHMEIFPDRETKDRETKDRETKDRETKDREVKHMEIFPDRETKDRETIDRETKDKDTKDREVKHIKILPYRETLDREVKQVIDKNLEMSLDREALDREVKQVIDKNLEMSLDREALDREVKRMADRNRNLDIPPDREALDREFALQLLRSDYENTPTAAHMHVVPEKGKKYVTEVKALSPKREVPNEFQASMDALFSEDSYAQKGSWKREKGKIIVKIQLEPSKDLLRTLQHMKAMKWGVPDLRKTKFLLEIILDSEFYLDYAVPPCVHLICQPETKEEEGALKPFVERKLDEYLHQQWMTRLEKIEVESKRQEEEKQKSIILETLHNMGFQHHSICEVIKHTKDLDEAITGLTCPAKLLTNLGCTIEEAEFALSLGQNDLSKAVNFLKQGVLSNFEKIPEEGSLFANDSVNIWDGQNFFFNLATITHKILTSPASHCMFCSMTLPKEPLAAVCDLCIATYALPFVCPGATGSTVRVLDGSQPEDEWHLSIVKNAFGQLKPIYASTRYKITKVEYYRNAVLERQYEEFLKRAQDKTEMFLWHGTADTNIKPIMKDNFSLNCLGKNSGNRGYYGAGIYFSSKHIRVVYDSKVLLCKVIVGKVYKWPESKAKQIGCGKMQGYDSHYSGEHSEGKDEFVIFDMERILPSYVVHVVPS